MLISKTVFTKWNSKTKKYYEDKGYRYTKMGDVLEVDVNDLKDGSRELVKIKCDYCNEEYTTEWRLYLQARKKLIQKDCCDNPKCTGEKAQEALQAKYNVNNIRELDWVNEKIKNTNLEKYGAENPFASDEIKEKIRNTNLEKYGVEVPTQNKDVQEKYRQTCIEKYGVENYAQSTAFRESMRGENNPKWKGEDVKHERIERNSIEYADWRKAVFARDHYTCQCCGRKSGDGHTLILNAHHNENWATAIDKRYDVENGTTLCKECHVGFHSEYGIKNNTKEQVFEYITNYNRRKSMLN